MSSPPSDMSLEDAAAVQQDLARPRSQQQEEDDDNDNNNDIIGAVEEAATGGISSEGVVAAAASGPSDESAKNTAENAQNGQIDGADATAASTTQEEGASQYKQGVAAAPSVEQHVSGTGEATQENASASIEEGTSIMAKGDDSGETSTSATLDALLGSLVSAAGNDSDNAAPTTAAAAAAGGEGDSSEGMSIQPEESATSVAVAAAGVDQNGTAEGDGAEQHEYSNATSGTAAVTQAEDGSMAAGGANTDSSMSTAVSSYAAMSDQDLSGPVPGLPGIDIAPSSATSTGDASSTVFPAQQQDQQQYQQTEQLPAIQQEATPFGTPTPAAAVVPPPFPSNVPSDPRMASSASQATGEPVVAASSSGSTPLYKPTPLATDPDVARQTAAQLLQGKPQNMSRLAKLRQRVEKDRFDGEAWLELIADAMQKGDLDRTREVFQGFLAAFPDNAREWIAYADLELSHGNNDRVNEIFGKCLRTSTSVQLWHFYLTYIRRTNPIDRSNQERAAPARDVITKAFEFSIAHVGADLEAGPIWFDYIEFLKEGEVSGTWEAQQKMDKLRQTYQRAVCIPLNNIELIWQGYDAFENNLNRATSKKFLQDRSPAYMTARATARQLQNFMGRLSFSPVPHKPNWDSSADQTQLRIWKELLAYEESDPMELADPASVRTRVTLAYKKALTQLRFYPEIWYMAAAFARKSDKPEEAITFLKSGMEANATSLLLNYAYAEAEEAKGSAEECHRVYNTLIERLQAEIDSTTASIATETKEALEEKARLEAHEKAQREQNMMGDNDQDDVGEEVRNQERENIKRAIADSKTGRLNELRRLAGSVWIMQMRFARRAEGIQAARAVFSRARKWPHVTWQVFEASAMLEMHWNKETKIAINVFEVGLKRFSDEVGFVQRYLDFLIMINDDGNARAVFERTVTKLPADKARPLWDRWADYVYQYGDLASIQKLDARLSETYPEVAAISRFTDRYTYLDLDDMAYIELGADDRETERKTRPNSPSPPPHAVKAEVVVPHMPVQPQQSMPSQIPVPNLPGPPGQFGAIPGAPAQNIPIAPPQHFAQQFNDNFGRNMNNSPHQGPPSIDGSVDNDRRRSGGGRPMNNNMMNNNKRRRSPSPTARRGRRPNSPPRVSRHTPPDDFPEGIPWLLSQLPSKTVFAAHGPILDWQHLMHLIATIHLPPPGADVRGRNRSISPRRGPPNGPQAGRRRSPDYSMRNRR